jgi:hypothetical protein
MVIVKMKYPEFVHRRLVKVATQRGLAEDAIVARRSGVEGSGQLEAKDWTALHVATSTTSSKRRTTTATRTS